MRKEKPAKVITSLTLEPEVLEKTKVLAESDNRNLSQYVNLLLKNNIAAIEKERGTAIRIPRDTSEL